MKTRSRQKKIYKPVGPGLISRVTRRGIIFLSIIECNISWRRENNLADHTSSLAWSTEQKIMIVFCETEVLPCPASQVTSSVTFSYLSYSFSLLQLGQKLVSNLLQVLNLINHANMEVVEVSNFLFYFTEILF